MNEATTIPAVSNELANASLKVFKLIFADSNGDVTTAVNTFAKERGDNKDMAQTLLESMLRTGLVKSEDALVAVASLLTGEKDKKVIYTQAWMSSNPSDGECVKFMDGIKDSTPQLLAIVIGEKKTWKMSDIRKQILRYPFTKDLYLMLAKMEAELKART